MLFLAKKDLTNILVAYAGDKADCLMFEEFMLFILIKRLNFKIFIQTTITELAKYFL